MTRTYSQIHRIDKHSEHNSIIWLVWPHDWVFVYQLSGSGFESSCSHLKIPWWSSNIYFFLDYRFVWRQRFLKKFDRLLHKNVPVFSDNDLFIFYSNNWLSFESLFSIKTVKSWLFKKYLKGKKITGTVFYVSCLATYQWKKLLKTAILLVQELIK